MSFDPRFTESGLLRPSRYAQEHGTAPLMGRKKRDRNRFRPETAEQNLNRVRKIRTKKPKFVKTLRPMPPRAKKEDITNE